MSVLADVLQYTWNIYRGVDFLGPIITIQGQDAEGLPIPAPEMLTATGVIHIRPERSSNSIFLTLSSGNGYLVFDGANGTIDPTIPASALTDLKEYEGAVGDLRITWSDGTQEIIAEIRANLRIPVTRT